MSYSIAKRLQFGAICLLLCTSQTISAKTQPATQAATQQDSKRYNDQMMLAVLWQQSAEARAVSYQTFNFAKLQLEHTLRYYKSNKLPAIVVDIDETILSNSHFTASTVSGKRSYHHDWAAWVQQAKAKPLPGILDFLNCANSKNVAIFYLSNRVHGDKEATMKNLKAFGFPQVKDSHVLLADKTTDSKENRRQTLAVTFEIIMLLGDQLTDFSAAFDHSSLTLRKQEVDKNQELFGKKFIILPNPTYGNWENAIYDYQAGLSIPAKLQHRSRALRD